MLDTMLDTIEKLDLNQLNADAAEVVDRVRRSLVRVQTKG